MANLAGFDATQVAEPMDFTAFPEGVYVAIITASEMKPTKDGNGQYLEFTFEILDGEYKSRKVWARLNLINSSNTAVDIAQRELGAICRSVGVIKPNDSSELHNIPLTIHVSVEAGKNNGKPQNKIDKYEPARTAASAPAAGGYVAPFSAPASQQPAPAQAAAAQTAPWQK
ncbi:MAG: DUF669 domain-containing protein [Porticoccaceae bacterium]